MTPAWIAALLTLGVPLALLALVPVVWLVLDSTLAMCLLPLVPLGLGAGYVYAGLMPRAAAVTGGGYLVLILGGALLFATPTQFEDAGVLVTIVAAIALAAFAAYCGWAAWDVYRMTSGHAPR